MTTVVATTDAIYSDSQCTSMPSFKTTKLMFVQHKEDEYLVGGCGVLDEMYFIANLLGEYGLRDLWKLHLTEHWPPKILKSAESELIVVTRTKEIYTLSAGLLPAPVNQDTYAVGSGAEYATSALAFDKSPIEAVEFACLHDPFSKPPIQQLKFPRRKRYAEVS